LVIAAAIVIIVYGWWITCLYRLQDFAEPILHDPDMAMNVPGDGVVGTHQGEAAEAIEPLSLFQATVPSPAASSPGLAGSANSPPLDSSCGPSDGQSTDPTVQSSWDIRPY
jgi:hypothetical protein